MMNKEQQDVIALLPTLVQLLQCHPSEQAKSDAIKEAKLLEQLAVAFGSCYDFSNNPAAGQFLQAFEALVSKRLAQPEWRAALREDHLLRVLQVVRLLTRDVQLRKALVNSEGSMLALNTVMSSQALLHFSGQVSPFQVELLTELASIAKRLAGDELGLAAMVQCDMQQVLIQLLASTDPAILPLVMVAIIGFAAHREHAGLVSNSFVLHLLLRIVAEYDLPFKRLAADLLALLARRESIVCDLLELNGLGRVVGQLAGGDSQLTASLLRVVCYMASDTRALMEIYQTGTIPVLLSLVSAAGREAAASGITPARVTDMQLVCTALTRICEDDELAAAVRTANGVSLLGRLLLVTPAPSQPDGREGERSGAGAGGGGELSSLRAYVLRALRFMFSMERNRKVFKRLFPPDLFASFIDVGHYNPNLAAYAGLVQKLEELSDKGRAALASALDDISADRDGVGGQDALRTVRGGQYMLYELLGKGGYGAVYKARRSRGDALVALKEVPLSDVALFGATPAEREQGVGRMGKEVDILSSMSHPHIVQYYESFVEGQHLYIAMELVEGVSLLDHLNSLAEKGRRMPESDIWQVLLAVCLALHYIHSVAKVVHRDLTPANIMLGPGVDGLRHAKIADFGLAKRLSGSTITAQSVVGTMSYTCPEIIQQEEYSEKADVWSLGCVLYQCMMLHPPFSGSNPLGVASKIVEGSYEPVHDPPDGPSYSLHLKQLQTLLMTVDPNKRPGMSEVAALVSGQLMAALERLTASEQRLQRALALERAHHRRGGSAGLLLGGLDTPASPMTHPSVLAIQAHPSGPHAVSTPPINSPIRQAGAPTPFAAMNTLRARRQLLEPLPTAMPSLASYPSNGLGLGVYSAGGGGALISPRPSGSNVPNGGSITGGGAGAAAAGQEGQAGEGSDAGAGSWGEPLTHAAPGGGSRLITLATSRLRPMQDPLTQMLAQLHKLMWIEQLPPGLTRDPRRRSIEVFRRSLFSSGTSAVTLKLHLAKLQVGDADIIRDTSGRPLEFGNTALGPPDSPVQPVLPIDGCLSYDQLSQVIEGLLQEKGYWSQASHQSGVTFRPSGTGTHVATTSGAGADLTQDQLPPSAFSAGMANGGVPGWAHPATRG